MALGTGQEMTVDIEQEDIPCHHHWIIEAPEGPTSEGVCRLCGEEREFSNSAAEGSPRAELAWRRRAAKPMSQSEEQSPTEEEDDPPC